MIRTLFYLLLLCGLGCSTKSENKNDENYDANPASEGQAVTADLISQGAALVKQNDCNSCHHLTSQIVGPAHMDVAKKYEFTNENIKLIADRIINGSSGVWGQIMMTPHPGLSQSDAEKMARYVLSLDGEKEPE